ncbi:MAG: YybH family protein [Solirubrobacterales bacterium]
MDGATAERAIEVPIDSLPPVDEHSTEVRAGADRAWEALIATLPRAFDTALSRRMASVLGCVYRRSRGDPSVIGSTLPGFVVARSVRPSTLALLGRHRFSSYALVFRLDELGPGRSRLSGETRAEFPGAKGRAYRGLVIGTGGHVRVVKRILAAVARRAAATTATLDRAQLADWLARYERAWRTAGTEALRDAFADDAYYSTGPYQQPHLGLEAIARMWEAERRGPDEVFQMRTEIVSVEGDTGVVRVEVAYGEPRRQQYRDLWIVRLDTEGRCVHFEEWPFWPPGSGGAPAGGADTLD